MYSPRQYVTPDRGGGVTGLRERINTLSPKSPQQLFGGGLLKNDVCSSTPSPDLAPGRSHLLGQVIIDYNQQNIH